jgi:hypothetical protein
MMRNDTRSSYRVVAARRGTAMSETVLILPLVVVILAITFYLGKVVVRIEHASVMARYETWRDVGQAPGPGSGDPTHPELNMAFFGGKADELSQVLGDNYFPEEPYDELRQAVSARSSDAAALTEAYIIRPGGEHRMSRGRREAFTVRHQNTELDWDRITSIANRPVDNPEQSPLVRGHTRIGNEWRYTNDWRASADRWADTHGGEPAAHHLRALRDAFLMGFDSNLDSLDGATGPEYSDQPMPQVPNTTQMSGLIRSLYLTAPGYAGPTVINNAENP